MVKTQLSAVYGYTRPILFIIIACIAAFVLSYLFQVRTLTRKDGVEFVRTMYNFGDVSPDQELAATFDFRNRHSRPVKITKIYTSCGCTASNAEGLICGPGESQKIPVTLSARGMTAPKSLHAQIVVVFDCGDRASLAIQAMLQPWVEFSPQELTFNPADTDPKVVVVNRKMMPPERFSAVSLEGGEDFAIKLRTRSEDTAVYEIGLMGHPSSRELQSLRVRELQAPDDARVLARVNCRKGGPVIVPRAYLATIDDSSGSSELQALSTQRFTIKSLDMDGHMLVSRIVGSGAHEDLLKWMSQDDGTFTVWLREAPQERNLKTDLAVYYSDQQGRHFGRLTLPVFVMRTDSPGSPASVETALSADVAK